MKYFLLSLTILLSTSLAASCQARICSLELRFVNKEIETPYTVSCESFEFSFSKVYSKKVITNRVLIEKFEKAFTSIIYSEESKKIDVRIKIYIKYRDETKRITVCVDRFNNIVINGHLILFNKKLTEFINNQIQ